MEEIDRVPKLELLALRLSLEREVAGETSGLAPHCNFKSDL